MNSNLKTTVLIAFTLMLTANAAYYEMKNPEQEMGLVDPKLREKSRNLGYSTMSSTGTNCYGCVNNSSMTRACAYRSSSTSSASYYCCDSSETYYKCLDSNSHCSNEFSDDRKYLGCRAYYYSAGSTTSYKSLYSTSTYNYTTTSSFSAGQVGHARIRNRKTTGYKGMKFTLRYKSSNLKVTVWG